MSGHVLDVQFLSEMSSFLTKYSDFRPWQWTWTYRTVICIPAVKEPHRGSCDVTPILSFDSPSFGMTRIQFVCFSNVRVTANWGTSLTKRLTPCGEEFLTILYSVTVWTTTGFITKNFFLCITLTVEHNYISPSSTVGIQLHASALYVGHLQVVI